MAAPSYADTLRQVRTILLETCERDGQGWNLHERARRKAYRKGINDAVDEINRALEAPVRRGRPRSEASAAR